MESETEKLWADCDSKPEPATEPTKPLFHTEGSHSEFTDEQLEELKLMGEPKPDSVEWGRWVGPKKHSHRHELMIHLAASGLSNKAIAQELQLTDSRVSIILSQPEIRNKIRLVQDTTWGGNAGQRFQSLIGDAIDTTEEIMNNGQEKGATRLSAARDLLDRALGKAPQKLEVEHTSLTDVLDRLDQIRNAPQGDAYQIPGEVEKPTDPQDAFLNDFIEADYVVGKKGTE